MFVLLVDEGRNEGACGWRDGGFVVGRTLKMGVIFGLGLNMGVAGAMRGHLEAWRESKVVAAGVGGGEEDLHTRCGTSTGGP